MKRFWSDAIRELKPYTPGEQPKDGILIKLNTNENPYPPSPKALSAMRAAAEDKLRLYPDPDCIELRAAVAAHTGVRPEQVFCGNGSDEVLFLAFLAFFFGRKVVFPDITYSFYPVYANLLKIGYKEMPLSEDFSLPVDAFCGHYGGVVLPNPNAPTGHAVSLDDLRRILESNPSGVVLVDEAYAAFSGVTAVPLLDEYPNLLVVQTLSKSHALAGLRVGFALGNEDLIAGLCCARDAFNSYTVDRVAMAGAIAALNDEVYFRYALSRVVSARDSAAQALRELGFSMPVSSANFLFVTHERMTAKELQEKLRGRGILVRHFDRPRIDNYLRITVGTDEQMKALCQALREILRREA